MKKLLILTILLLGVGCKQAPLVEEPISQEVIVQEVQVQEETKFGFAIDPPSNENSVRQPKIWKSSLVIKKPQAGRNGAYYDTPAFQIHGDLFTEYERDQMLVQLRQKFINKEPLNNSLGDEITDTAILASLLTDFKEECGGISLNDYQGVYPLPFDEVLDTIGLGC